MTSILKVSEIQDPTNSNTALTIDGAGRVTATNIDLPSGTVVTAVSNYSTTTAVHSSTSYLDVVSVTFTAKYSSADSDLLINASLHHGVGPRSTNLDPYGLNAEFKFNATGMGRIHRIDVPAGSGDGSTYGPEWDVRTSSYGYNTNGSQTWSAGDTVTITLTAACDSNGSIWINRPANSTSSNGTSAIQVFEVKK
jgi:hypothetical protein